jgi:raffinose/stachyose/melibiose transport system substrate-binding protein
MKKILALCLALTMALAVFAGCSGAASSSAPAAGSASGSASTGGSATGKQLSGKVVYWSMYNEGEPEAMAIQKAADMFMEDYPDCEVEIQWIGRSNQDITGPALEGGEQLDILDNFSYDKSTDRYLDITDMMNEPALGQEDMTVAESILPVLNLANAQGQEKAGLETDKYYGVQMFPWVVGFFYNKDLFQQAGITETPETWTEFMEACQKLKDAGINAVTCDDAYMTLIPNNYLARLVGSDTIAAMSASASDPAWQSEEVKQAFAAMEALSPFMSPQTATNKYPAGQQEFALGEAAMYLNASWMPSEVADTAGEDFPWGFFAFPQVEDGAEGSGYVSVGGVPLAVYSGSPNPEAAKEFLRYVASKEVQDYLAEQGGAPTTVGSEWPGARAECTDVIAAADKVASLNCDLSSEFVSAVFTMEMNKVLTQQTTADKAVSTLTGEASKY